MGLRVYLELRVRLRVGLEDDGGVVPAEAEIVRDRLGRVRDRGRGRGRVRGRVGVRVAAGVGVGAGAWVGVGVGVEVRG